MREGKIKADDFIVHKASWRVNCYITMLNRRYQRLGKNPEDYPDGKSQPHVQVALRMKAKGGTARSGDVVPYVFCLGSDGESSKTGQADKAKHPDEVRKSGDDCKIGGCLDSDTVSGFLTCRQITSTTSRIRSCPR